MLIFRKALTSSVVSVLSYFPAVIVLVSSVRSIPRFDLYLRVQRFEDTMFTKEEAKTMEKGTEERIDATVRIREFLSIASILSSVLSSLSHLPLP